jgi:hypothetical protein
MTDGIWPARSIALVRRGHMEGSPFLSDDAVANVMRVLTGGGHNFLDKPVVLDAGTIRLIGLVLLGKDAVSPGSLILRVTNERFYNIGPLVRLTVVSTPAIGSSDRRGLLPGKVGDMLDEYVTQIRAELGSEAIDPNARLM